MNDYDYTDAGFSPFFTKSIDDNGSLNLDMSGSTNQSRELNYDQSPQTGSPGDKLVIGNIVIDGVEGRLSIFDENKNEIVRLGTL